MHVANSEVPVNHQCLSGSLEFPKFKNVIDPINTPNVY